MSAAAPALLEARGVTRDFRVGGGLLGRSATLRAVDAVDLDVRPGEVLTIVGESGSGKTTLGRCLLGLMRPTAGTVRFDGEEVGTAGRARTRFRRRVQPIFQNPYSSLDPRWPVARTVREPLDAFRIGTRAERERRVGELLESVGLAQRHADARPHELSGGQRQRVAIAAALALGPDLIVADEPVSALDVLVQAQILNLICDLQRELGVHSSSSPTTWRWSSTSPTGSRSCTWAGSSSRGPPTRCSRGRSTRIRRRSSTRYPSPTPAAAWRPAPCAARSRARSRRRRAATSTPAARGRSTSAEATRRR